MFEGIFIQFSLSSSVTEKQPFASSQNILKLESLPA